MPQPRCDECGKRIPPDDRVTSPTELDDAGVMVRPSTSWHTACLADEGDALEDPHPGHEEGDLWQPH